METTIKKISCLSEKSMIYNQIITFIGMFLFIVFIIFLSFHMDDYNLNKKEILVNETKSIMNNSIKQVQTPLATFKSINNHQFSILYTKDKKTGFDLMYGYLYDIFQLDNFESLSINGITVKKDFNISKIILMRNMNNFFHIDNNVENLNIIINYKPIIKNKE